MPVPKSVLLIFSYRKHSSLRDLQEEYSQLEDGGFPDLVGHILPRLQQLIDLLKSFKRDADFVREHFERDRLRFLHVHLQPIYSATKDCTEAYHSRFSELEEYLRTQKGSLTKKDKKLLEDTLSSAADRFWFLRNETRENAARWLMSLPKDSDERTFIWSVINFFVDYTDPNASIEQFREDANSVADSRDEKGEGSDTTLSTPQTRLVKEVVKSARSREEVLEALQKEREGVLARYKSVARAYQELAVKLDESVIDSM